MDYKTRAKNRILKRRIAKTLKLLKFHSLNATTYHKVIMLGAIIVLTGLFFPWFEISGIEGLGVQNGFSRLLGISGITILLLNIFVIFVLLSDNTKEKFKQIFNVSFKDYHPPIIAACVILLMISNSIISMRSLRTFESEIVFGRGVFIDISGTIILLIGGICLKKYYDKNLKGIYSETVDGDEEEDSHDDNMKLPF